MLRAILGRGGYDLRRYGENPTGRENFTDKEIGYLKKNRCLIYHLNGMSMNTLAKAGLQFASGAPFCYVEMASMKARIGQVAILPGIFLPESEYKTFDEQLKMVAELSKQIHKKARGIEVIIGNFPDYLEFAFQHQHETSEQLLNQGTESGFPITTVAQIGNFKGHAEINHNANNRDLIDVSFSIFNDREDKQFGGYDPSSYHRRVIPMFVPSGK